MSDEATIVFAPDPGAVERSQLTAFTRFCEAETSRRFESQAALQAFALADLGTFWDLFRRWSGLVAEGDPSPVFEGDTCESATFFPGLRLSYAENLLASGPGREDHRTAVTACDETGFVLHLTRGELRRQVVRAARGLRALGLGPGDRVVAIARNTADSVVASLAATALGATWSSASPDIGTEGVLNRFAPLSPALLFAHTHYPYQGVDRSLVDRVREVAAGLPSLEGVVLLDEGRGTEGGVGGLPLHVLSQLGEDHPEADAGWSWPRLPFNHPLFILFSSGTTGPPKCIMHGIGGTLLEHLKAQRLHSDFGPADTLLFQTSCGWMMWNWQLSALACGTRIVLYDGSVTHPEEDALWRVLGRERVTVFGTSPPYLQFSRDAGIVPRERADLGALRAMQSTGSILFDRHYDWVRDNVKTIPLQSISGGTDIIGCFVLGSPNLPVYRGEAQCVSLGLDVRALAAEATPQGLGELICANPFPSRPIGLFGDAEGRRFHDAYFSQNHGVWTHGDFIEITPRGSARIHGRSDGVLNIRGIRIGPAEIYQILAHVPEIVEAMAIEQRREGEPGGSRLALLVVLKAGLTLDRPLTLRIKKELKERGSPVHVPAVVAQVAELPTTHSNKRSERAARDAANGDPVKNAGALRNPASLDAIRAHPALA
jgi:acetoacetyl-CoA synthetase